MISLKLHNFKSLKDSNLIFSADIENRILRVLSKGLFKKNNTQLTVRGNRIYIKSYKIHAFLIDYRGASVGRSRRVPC